MAGFVAKIIKETALVYDIRWMDERGIPLFAIFEVEKAKWRPFLEKLESDDLFILEDYGTVLHKGEGEPSEELKAELRQKYGMYE